MEDSNVLLLDFTAGKLRIFKTCYKWQAGSLKDRRWAASLRDESYKIGLGYISQHREKCS